MKRYEVVDTRIGEAVGIISCQDVQAAMEYALRTFPVRESDIQIIEYNGPFPDGPAGPKIRRCPTCFQVLPRGHLLGIILLLAVALLACGPGYDVPEPDYYTDLGIGIRVEEGAAEWAYAPDLGERVDTIAIKIAELSGHSAEEVDGLIVVFVDGYFACAGLDLRQGCCHGNKWITISTHTPSVQTENGSTIWEWTPESVEQSFLDHELLHFFIGDPNHESDLWNQLNDI
jgi:hypothetical protein